MCALGEVGRDENSKLTNTYATTYTKGINVTLDAKVAQWYMAHVILPNRRYDLGNTKLL